MSSSWQLLDIYFHKDLKCQILSQSLQVLQFSTENQQFRGSHHPQLLSVTDIFSLPHRLLILWRMPRPKRQVRRGAFYSIGPIEAQDTPSQHKLTELQMHLLGFVKIPKIHNSSYCNTTVATNFKSQWQIASFCKPGHVTSWNSIFFLITQRYFWKLFNKSR